MILAAVKGKWMSGVRVTCFVGDVVVSLLMLDILSKFSPK